MNGRCGWLVLLLVLAWSYPSQAKGPKLRYYTVQQGDSCWSIAQKLFGSAKKYHIIHKHNKLGKFPHLLKRGQRLLVPSDAPEPNASVEWFQKKVSTKPPQSIDWYRARKNMALWNLYKLKTGVGSSAQLRFRDASSLRVRQKALVVIYGNRVKSGKAKFQKTKVEVKSGIVRGGLAKLFKDAGLTIKTPTSTLETKQGMLQVDVQKKSTAVSVYDGKVELHSDKKKVELKKNVGVIVRNDGTISKPKPLPKAPVWKGNVRKAIVFTMRGEKGTISTFWKPVKQVKKYRMELSRDAAFRTFLADRIVRDTKLAIGGLFPGTYYARLAAIDAARLESRPSKTIRVEIAPLSVSKKLHRAKDGTLETVGLLKLVAPKQIAKRVEFAINDGAFQSFEEPIRLQKVGSYLLRFRFAGGDSAETGMRVRLLRYKAEFLAPKKVRFGGKDFEVVLKLSDERGRPAHLPGLQLRAFPAGALRMGMEEAGVYRAMVPMPKKYPGKWMAVRALWTAGEIKLVWIRVLGPKVKVPKISKGRTLNKDLFDKIVSTDPDPDGDGLPSSVDRCPNVREDFDQFEDSDGCPELDNDLDGVPDLQDKCPNKPETINGKDDEDGCPDQGDSLVSLSGKEIKIKEKVFFDTASDQVKEQSLGLLTQVASFIKSMWRLKRLRIEGHTDNVGNPEKNVDLSQRRAQRVKIILEQKGVPPGILVAKGFGDKFPVDSNDNKEGRSKNRRVAFRVLETAPEKKQVLQRKGIKTKLRMVRFNPAYMTFDGKPERSFKVKGIPKRSAPKPKEPGEKPEPPTKREKTSGKGAQKAKAKQPTGSKVPTRKPSAREKKNKKKAPAPARTRTKPKTRPKVKSKTNNSKD